MLVPSPLGGYHKDGRTFTRIAGSLRTFPAVCTPFIMHRNTTIQAKSSDNAICQDIPPLSSIDPVIPSAFLYQ